MVKYSCGKCNRVFTGIDPGDHVDAEILCDGCWKQFGS